MTALCESIKKSLRFKHSYLDDEIQSNVDTCLLLLRGAGILESKAVEETEDKLIQKACELYCKWQFDFDGKADRFQKAYEGLRDFMALGGDYTIESTE